MGKTLSTAQVEAYRRDGFLLPLNAMDAAQARRYRGEVEAFEARIGSPLPQAPRKYRSRSYLLFDWAQQLVRHPAILDAVEDLIGPDILVYTATWFIKEANTPSFAAWHQDSTFFGLVPNHEHVTAWLALSDATAESGCMQFLPGSNRRGQRAHSTGLNASVNDAGQYIREEVEGGGAVDCCLSPGQFSLHNTLLVHQSGANESGDRRIGIGVSYIPTHVRHAGPERLPALLVRGIDRYGHFDLDPSPRADFSPEAEEAHERSFGRWRDGYVGETARHAAAYPTD